MLASTITSQKLASVVTSVSSICSTQSVRSGF
jgi:hypothetical protein